MKILNKKNKGITLVALVITIIILLILAGISIAQLTGNGLFENAKLAKEKYWSIFITNKLCSITNFNYTSRPNKIFARFAGF